MISIGLGFGVGATIFVGLPLTTGLPGGVSATVTCEQFVTFPPFDPFGCDFCCTASFAYLNGFGLAANVGVIGVIEVGLTAPKSGPYVSVGVAAGTPANLIGALPEAALDVDLSSGAVTLTVPTKLGVGSQLYMAVKIAGNCRTCCDSSANIKTCMAGITGCVQRAIDLIGKAVNKIIQTAIQPGKATIVKPAEPTREK